MLNDEGHHCYRHKPGEDAEGDLTGEDRIEAEKNNEAARVWISGLEIVKRKLGVRQVLDLSATPFFLRGSGYAEGTLFPWTVTDFSLMDAIECWHRQAAARASGRKHPRRGHAEVPRSVGDHPGRHAQAWTQQDERGTSIPLSLPVHASRPPYEALYGHYEKIYEAWEQGENPCSALLHRGLQQHIHVQAGLRLHLWL